MVTAMSESNEQDTPKTATADEAAESGDVIPVEVVPPDGATASPERDLEQKLAAAEKEKKENWDRYLRAAADLENLRKRQKREVDEAKFETKSKVLKEMLPVVDNLERAVGHAEKQGGGDPGGIVEGVRLVLRQFAQAFERCGVTAIDAKGKPFDPNLHVAVSQIETGDHPPGTVLEVLQTGYKIGERLLRPSLTVVSKAPAAPAPTDGGGAPTAAPPASDEPSE
jgi:molecular chaperone GrpE